MVKIGIAILFIGVVYSYGVQAEDLNNAEVASVDVSENKDSSSDSSDSKSDSEVDLFDQSKWGLPQMPQMPQMPPMFQNFPGFRMPMMPRMPSLEDIKNMAPNGEFSKVYGSGASFSSSQKVVNGELVEDKQYGKVVTNNNGEVEEKEFGDQEQ